MSKNESPADFDTSEIETDSIDIRESDPVSAHESDNDDSGFIHFPPREEVVQRLRTLESLATELAPLFEPIADRLGSKAYDRFAFVFILIEMLYELDESVGGKFRELLARLVLALTEDIELTRTALGAFEEIRQTLEPVAPEAPAEPIPDSEADERLTVELMQAQKGITDAGLSTRVSIELTLSSPSRHSVGQTLREINALRARIRHFEAQLRNAEERILEAIGVLD